MKYKANPRSNRQSWPIKLLTTAVMLGLTGTLAQADITRKPIGDLEIYKAAKPGTASIFMMLDISGSMDKRSIRVDYGTSFSESCSENAIASDKISLVIYNRMPKLAANGSIIKDDDGNSIMVPNPNSVKETINYTPEGCESGKTIRFSRMERLKLALIELIADNVYDNKGKLKPTGTLADDYAIGVGAFSYKSDGKSAYVLSPTRVLTPDQRIELIKQIKDLVANGGTPTAPALAESGAYMMGTTTINDVKVVAEREYFNKKDNWRRCYGNSSSLSYDNELGIAVYDCNNWGSWSTNSNVLPAYTTSSNIDHDDNGRTYFAGDNSYSSFTASVATSKKINTDENAYISPLNDDECSGNGIYLLTDGEPSNNITDSNSINIMDRSLTGSSLSMSSCNNSESSGLKGSTNQGWGCMATYSQLLRNPANPGKLPIKTATVGFGKSFAGLTGTRSIIINGKQKEVINCESGSASKNSDVRNLCRLGERKGDNEVKTFGDGGFYYTEESTEIAASVVDFASGLVQIINTAPSGTITIPEDPYRASNQLPYAYLPMLDPEIVSANSIWRGNLKKYNLDQGTLFGKSNSKLYKDIAGDLDENTQDVWQTANFEVESKTANNDIAAGGVYAQLQAPSGGLGSVRTIYVEDYTSSSNKTPILRKLTVNGSGKPVGFDTLVDTVAYSQINQRRLLSFLGFDGVLTNDGQPTTPLTTLTKNLTLTKPTNETKVLGGVVHSKPEAISYGATLDDKGNITDTRDDYVLFGSMDGALHLVDAEDGKEEVAIIPRQMLINQSEALVSGSFKADIGQPYFGVDAPWLVKTDYNYDLPNNRVTVDTASGKGMLAYGGLRMGGEALYGMDITKKSEPKILFTITPLGISSTTSGKSATTGFERLGQIWSKPVAAKIRLTKGSDLKKNTAPTDVLIFGGGYDMGYEEDEYVPTTAKPAKGSAIYMVNAQTGELIWSTSSAASSGKNVKIDSMINSITGGITVLDRDNDGLIDHIYAADLGGQVFRADFENARIEQFGFDAVSAFSNKGVTRILNVAPTNKKLAYRFYESPIVSFFRRESGPDNGKLFAMVNVISGNRSAPLSILRDDNNYANRVYGIIDNDVTNADLYKSVFSKTVTNLTEAKLVNLGDEIPNIASQTTDPTRKAKKDAAIAAMIGTAKKGTAAAVAASKNGWFYPLTRFDGYSNVRYNKGIGDSVVINNLLYTSVYNPDKVYGNTASCTAKITGGSERQIYCLPYGVCMEDTSISGTGGFVPAGQGIQELALGAYNADNTDVKVLIGTTTIADRIEAANRAKYGKDSVKDESNIKDLYSGTDKAVQDNGDGSSVEYLFNERYTMQPKAWYERK